MLPDQRVKIEVVTADALAFDTELLVLKHAQVSLGVDAAAKQRLRLDQGMKLGAGNHLIVNGQPAVGAQKVVFLGVPPLQEFGYPEIRLFARRAMALAGQEFPYVQEIALTLHGAGYGLDEIACFDAELGGLVDAVRLKTVPTSLERVVILEADVGRADRLRQYLDGTFANQHGSTTLTVSARDGAGANGLRTEPAVSADRQHAFVAMPFAEEFEDRFHYGIQPSVHACGLLCERIDQEVFTGDVVSRVKQKIRSASLVVADLTGANPNVYLEVGFAWAAEVPTVLLRHRGSDLKFDVQGERCLEYTTIQDLESRLTKELRELRR